MLNACALKAFQQGLAYETTNDATGKLIPNNRDHYKIVIATDNPDIISITTEKRLAEQALEEYEKQIEYGIKVFSFVQPVENPDIIIKFVDSDPYFTDNILAYAGYPNGSLRGRLVFNNKFVWLDGYPKTGAELRKLGVELPGMRDYYSYQTYNVRQTIKHEIGHNLGLQHSIEDESVMNAYYGVDRIMFGDIDKFQLNLKYGKAGMTKRAKPDSYIKSVMRRKI